MALQPKLEEGSTLGSRTNSITTDTSIRGLAPIQVNSYSRGKGHWWSDTSHWWSDTSHSVWRNSVQSGKLLNRWKSCQKAQSTIWQYSSLAEGSVPSLTAVQILNQKAKFLNEQILDPGELIIKARGIADPCNKMGKSANRLVCARKICKVNWFFLNPGDLLLVVFALSQSWEFDLANAFSAIPLIPTRLTSPLTNQYLNIFRPIPLRWPLSTWLKGFCLLWTDLHTSNVEECLHIYQILENGCCGQ